MLELQQIAGRVEEHESAVLFGHATESRRDVSEEWDLTGDRQVMQGLEIGRIAERDAEMAGVKTFRLFRRRALGQVADQLVTKEIQRYPVMVAPSQLAAQELIVKVRGPRPRSWTGMAR